MRRSARVAAALAAAVALAALAVPAAAAQAPVVRAVLFYSPTCGHCEYVINELLLPVWFPENGGAAEIRYDESLGADAPFLLATNGTLEVLLVNIRTEAGLAFHVTAGEALGIPEARLGAVPRLVVGDRYLIGSREIPGEFPGILAAALAGGGLDWPGLPGLEEALAAVPAPATTTTSAPATTTTTFLPSTATTSPAGTPATFPASTPTTTAVTTTTTGTATTGAAALPAAGDGWADRFRRDETANSLALIVLGLMLLSLVGAFWVGRRPTAAGGPGWAVPLLALAGLGIAAYLAFVEGAGTEAVCGPVGDCNAVQQSEWARLFGVIPIGVVGVAGYAVVLAAWAVARFGSGRAADWARVALLGGAVAGVAFSIYLTFLEPFVIGATCLWCLGSAVIVTLLMWLTVRTGTAARRRLRQSPRG